MAGIGRRVDLSAAVLDKHIPGWAARVDTERLDINHHNHCVLGQLDGTYYDGVTRLRNNGATPAQLSGFIPESCAEGVRLERIWLKHIQKRVKHPERFAAAAA